MPLNSEFAYNINIYARPDSVCDSRFGAAAVFTRQQICAITIYTTAYKNDLAVREGRFWIL